MLNDEEVVPQEPIETYEPEDTSETSEPEEPQEPTEPEDADKDYRGKLNIANRLLEKEGYEFKGGKWVKSPDAPRAKAAPSKQDDLGTLDGMALMSAGITNEEDIAQVIEYAKFKKIPVREAIKTQMLQSMLKEQAEERKTATATITKGGARGSSKTTGEDFLKTAERTGILPDTDDGMKQLAQARLDRKKART